MNNQRLIIETTTTPALKSFVKLRQDKGRDRWVILAPERILTPDDTAVTVLQLCDGKASVGEIAAKLAIDYNAPVDVIEQDIITMMQELSDKGYISS